MELTKLKSNNLQHLMNIASDTEGVIVGDCVLVEGDLQTLAAMFDAKAEWVTDWDRDFYRGAKQ